MLIGALVIRLFLCWISFFFNPKFLFFNLAKCKKSSELSNSTIFKPWLKDFFGSRISVKI